MANLLSISDLSTSDVTSLFSLASKYIDSNRQPNKKHELLAGRTLINLFFENSTRTLTSFELAGKRLGADVINMHVEISSIKKGETMVDTALTLNAMHPDFIVIRHGESGAVHLLSRKLECSVINAGDGSHEHPTQALLDAFTIQRRVKKINGLTVAICGDILHSRVARSNMKLLTLLGAQVHVIAPPTLMPHSIEDYGVKAFTSMDEGLKGADVVMMLRVQKERMSGCYIPSAQEYFAQYGLTYERLKHANDDVFVMHPGPVNRGLEISSALADDINRSVILDQVESGVAIRQAVLEFLA